MFEGLIISKRDYYVIWTAYFDAKRTRKRGRRVLKNLAVDAPTIEELKQVIEAMDGLQVSEVNPEKRFPASWWDRSGYIKIRSSRPKNRLLNEIASKLRELRLLKAKRK